MPDSLIKLSEMKAESKRWQTRIHKIKQELLALGEMRPGALSKQYNVCGKAGCRCKDEQNPKKHGPYYQISYTHLGRSKTEFVKRDAVIETRKQLANHAKFKRLTQEWIDLSLRIAKAKRQAI